MVSITITHNDPESDISLGVSVHNLDPDFDKPMEILAPGQSMTVEMTSDEDTEVCVSQWFGLNPNADLFEEGGS